MWRLLSSHCDSVLFHLQKSLTHYYALSLVCGGREQSLNAQHCVRKWRRILMLVVFFFVKALISFLHLSLKCLLCYIDSMLNLLKMYEWIDIWALDYNELWILVPIIVSNLSLSYFQLVMLYYFNMKRFNSEFWDFLACFLSFTRYIEDQRADIPELSPFTTSRISTSG